MCQKFGIKTVDWTKLAERFGLCQTSDFSSIRLGQRGLAIKVGECGTMVPFFPVFGYKGSDGKRIYNARSETVDSKEFFKEDYALRKCVLLGSYFFENDLLGREKQFRRSDHGLCYFAAIYNKEEEFCLLTEGSEDFDAVHPRFPVVLNNSEAKQYLIGKLSTKDFLNRERVDLVLENYPIQGKMFNAS